MSFVTREMVTSSFTGTFNDKYIKLTDGIIEATGQIGNGVTAGTHIKIDNLFSDGLFKMNSDVQVDSAANDQNIKDAIRADITPDITAFNTALSDLKTAQEAAQAPAQGLNAAQKREAQTAALKNAVTALMPNTNITTVLYAGLCFPVNSDKTRMKAVKRTIVLLKLLISKNYSDPENIDKLLDRAGIMQLIMIKELELGVVPSGASTGFTDLKTKVKKILNDQYDLVFATTGWSRDKILTTEMAKKYNKYKSKYLALKNQ